MAPLLVLYRAVARVWEPLWRFALNRRLARGREDPARLPEKFGHPGVARPDAPVLWLHALSVGESLALNVLMRRLIEERPGLVILLTTSTRASAEALGRLGLPEGVIHQYAPVDAVGPMRRFLAHWRPQAAVFSEFDLWPVRVLETAAAGVPMMMINTRMSEAQLRRRRRIAGAYGALLRRMTRILVQDAGSAGRIEALGAQPGAVAVAGVLKSAAEPLPDAPALRAELTQAIAGRPCWLAAATETREEAQVLDAHRLACQTCPDLLMILAPRQMRHADATAAAAWARFSHVARRSAGDPVGPATQVYIADTLGEMGLWYRLAPVSFLGHSMPVAPPPLTGKNPFEAAALGSVILHGPDVAHFADSYGALHADGGARQVADAAALAAAVLDLTDPQARAPLVAGARATIARSRAPLDRTVAEVLGHLDATD